MSGDEEINPIAEIKPPEYILKLFIAGQATRSIQAITAAKAFCEAHLQGRYQLEIIDIYQHPEDTRAEQILSAPTLLRKFPLPKRKLVGDISDMAKLRIWLGLDKNT